MRVSTVPRPYVVYADNLSFLASSHVAQDLIDRAPSIHRATASRVTFTDEAGVRMVIIPATRGGGPAFIVSKREVSNG